jgi:hypothetical protein
MNRVYATRFRIVDGDLDAALSEYESWIRDFYKRNHGTESVAAFGAVPDLPSGHSLEVKSHQKNDDQVFEIDWIYFDAANEAFWINEVRISYVSSEVHVEHQVQLLSSNFSVEPLRIRVGSPRVVRSLCRKYEIKKGGMRLRSQTYSVVKATVDDLLGLLESSERTVPLVLISPYSDGSDSLIDADALAESLAGVGIVASAANSEATWEISAELGAKFGCYNGAARIYWPRFSRTDNKFLHPLFVTRDDNAVWVQRAIEKTIFVAASERFLRYNHVTEIVRHSYEIKRLAQMAALGKQSEWKELAESYSNDLASMEARLRELEIENSNLKSLNAYSHNTPEDESPENQDQAYREPGSVLEAVEFAREDFQSLDILESSVTSANESPFRRPAEVYAALERLSSVAQQWAQRRSEGQPGGDIRQMLIESGLGRRVSMHISDTTRGRHGADYTFKRRNGEQGIFEPHVTLGSGDVNSCCSIHFVIDSDRNMFEVGYVGKHLPNTKS